MGYNAYREDGPPVVFDGFTKLKDGLELTVFNGISLDGFLYGRPGRAEQGGQTEFQGIILNTRT